MEKTYNPDYDALSREDKENLLLSLAQQQGLKLLEFKEFERYGKKTYTGLFQKGDGVFVFVPGAKVELGWKGKAEDFNEETLLELAYASVELEDDEDLSAEEIEALTEKIARSKGKDSEFLEELTEYFNDYTSEIEEVFIHPLFVEVNYRQSCWKKVERSEIDKHEEWLEYIDMEDIYGPHIEVEGEVKLYKDKEGWQAEVYQDYSFEELREELERQGYSLPTRREWEYFAGGGKKTLFPWGEDMDLSITLPYINDYGLNRKEIEYPLERPNFFGLVIAHYPYEREIVYDDGFHYKGGDGGCNLCGGLGPVLGYFPISPYYEDKENKMEEKINGGFDFYRRVIRIKAYASQ